MYSSISKHDGVNYSRKLSELRRINPNPAPVSHDSISQEKILSSTTGGSAKSKKGMIILAGVILLLGFFAFRFIKNKKRAQSASRGGFAARPPPRTRPPPPREAPASRSRNRDPRSGARSGKPQWVIQLAVLLGIGVIAGGTWLVLKKSGKYDF